MGLDNFLNVIQFSLFYLQYHNEGGHIMNYLITYEEFINFISRVEYYMKDLPGKLELFGDMTEEQISLSLDKIKIYDYNGYQVFSNEIRSGGTKEGEVPIEGVREPQVTVGVGEGAPEPQVTVGVGEGAPEPQVTVEVGEGVREPKSRVEVELVKIHLLETSSEPTIQLFYRLFYFIVYQKVLNIQEIMDLLNNQLIKGNTLYQKNIIEQLFIWSDIYKMKNLNLNISYLQEENIDNFDFIYQNTAENNIHLLNFFYINIRGLERINIISEYIRGNITKEELMSRLSELINRNRQKVVTGAVSNEDNGEGAGAGGNNGTGRNKRYGAFEKNN